MTDPAAFDAPSSERRPDTSAPDPEAPTEGEEAAGADGDGAADPPEALDERKTLASAFIDAVREAIEANDSERTKSLCGSLHPADLADLIELLREEERVVLIDHLGDDLPAEVLAELDWGLTEEVVNAMGAQRVAEAVAALDTDDAAFILEDLDEAQREEILAAVPAQDRFALNQAFDYPEESAGRLMQRDVLAAPSYWTVGQIIDRLRASEDLPDRFYEVFVIDPAYKPIGAAPLSKLLRTQRDVQIKEIMDEGLRPVAVETDQEEVAYLFEQYNLISTPVVDAGGRLVGMITVDDVVEIVHEETHEDMLALGGVEADTGLSDTVIETVRSRFSWLAINLGTAVLASFVISLFDAAIAKVVALAVLMPIVASMGGNAGTQTLTVAVRSLATKDLTGANARRIVGREAMVGLMNGTVFAVIMGALAALWYFATTGKSGPSMQLGGVVAAAMVINLVCAGLAGILIPLWLDRIGQDPAVSSAVFVTTVTDIVGFFVFLGLAAVVLL
ncbi:MAG: magnesium transporter [Parvularculaceae bacterium]